HTLRDTPNPGTLLVNLNAELTAAFGSGWASRSDLYFGIIANRNNAPASGIGSAPAQNGDPSRTIYASKGTGSANSTTPWSFTSSALGVSATAIGGFMDAIATVSANSNAVMTMSQSANPVPWNNSWSVWNPVPGAGFSIFTGGIQRAFGSAPGTSQEKMLDIHRVPGDGSAPSYVSTVRLTNSGDLWVGRLYYQLSTAVAPVGGGTVTGAGVYPQNAVVQLTATPAATPGNLFLNWTGTTTSTTNPLSVTMDGTKSYTANFGIPAAINAPTVTDVTPTGATLGGTVTSLGDGAVVERGIVRSVVSVNADPLLDGAGVTKVVVAGDIGSFSTAVSGLVVGTPYAFKAYITTSVGTAYTSVAQFTPGAPTVASTPTVTAVTDTSATLGGNVTNISPGKAIERGIVYSLAATNADPLLDGTGVTKATRSGGKGIFSLAVTGLTPATTYAFKVFMKTSVGTGAAVKFMTTYSDVRFFTTDTTPDFTGGLGSITGRVIRAGETQVFGFNLPFSSSVAFSGSGASAGMLWQLIDAAGAEVASGTGNLSLSKAIALGNYRLRISNPGTSTETFSLNLNASTPADPKPDISVGLEATTATNPTSGINAYFAASSDSQSAVATSSKAAAKDIFFLIDNDDVLPDSMRISGPGPDSRFKVAYKLAGKNVTAAVIAGTARTVVIGPDADAVPFSVKISPDRRSTEITEKLTIGGKLTPVFYARSFIGNVTVSASSDPTKTDVAKFRLNTLAFP
ncbi:MAG: hypothetical protein KGR69_09360, partial [Verrucomicrobia bacterium]|nr:hypothetical protein [Verrucomicrobiota bacterium]